MRWSASSSRWILNSHAALVQSSPMPHVARHTLRVLELPAVSAGVEETTLSCASVWETIQARFAPAEAQSPLLIARYRSERVTRD